MLNALDDPRDFFLTLDALEEKGIQVPLSAAQILWQSSRAFHRPDPSSYERYGEWRLEIARAARRKDL